MPKFVEFCLLAIEQRDGWLQEGVYRLSGSVASIQRLRIAVNSCSIFAGGKIETKPRVQRSPKLVPKAKFSASATALKDRSQDAFEPYSAIVEQLKCGLHELTGSLKLFFRELQSPLLAADAQVLNALVQLGDSLQSSNAATDKSVAVFGGQIDSLSLLKQTVRNVYGPLLPTIARLFLHLHKVAQHQSANKMNANTLAVVFTPTLFPDAAGFNHSLLYVTATLIQNASFIFD